LTRAVELLLRKEKVDVNAINQHLNTPLHFATEQGSMAIVELLLGRDGIKLGMASRRLLTPLDKAFSLNHTEIAELLEARGAPANRRPIRH
jgi:ankyrin repeat protein